jgi:hypothetical protein
MRTSNTTIVICYYDGTLVDTRQKKLNVTRRIVEAIAGNGSESFPARNIGGVRAREYHQKNIRCA